MTPTQVPQQQPAPAQQQQNVPLFPMPPVRCWRRAVNCNVLRGATKTKSEPAAASARPVNNNAALERLASVSERVQARPAISALEKAPAKKEAYRWKATNPVAEVKEVVATPKALKKALEHEKRRNWRQSLRLKPLNATRGRPGEPAPRCLNWWSRWRLMPERREWQRGLPAPAFHAATP